MRKKHWCLNIDLFVMRGHKDKEVGNQLFTLTATLDNCSYYMWYSCFLQNLHWTLTVLTKTYPSWAEALTCIWTFLWTLNSLLNILWRCCSTLRTRLLCIFLNLTFILILTQWKFLDQYLPNLSTFLLNSFFLGSFSFEIQHFHIRMSKNNCAIYFVELCLPIYIIPNVSNHIQTQRNL